MHKDQLSIIKKIFDFPLPGKKAHAVMARNLNRTNYSVPEDARMSAVMILLFPNETDQLELVLTQRSSSGVRDSHSGQMSFPGGKTDPEDQSFEHTALRETREEVGVPESVITVLGAISSLYIPVSNFLVYPYVGYVDHQPEFIREEREVAEVITCDLQYLIDYEEPSSTNIRIRKDLILKDVPYFNVKDKVVWGATSMMLHEFLSAIRIQLADNKVIA